MAHFAERVISGPPSPTLPSPSLPLPSRGVIIFAFDAARALNLRLLVRNTWQLGGRAGVAQGSAPSLASAHEIKLACIGVGGWFVFRTYETTNRITATPSVRSIVQHLDSRSLL